jgi:hypothetical protein
MARPARPFTPFRTAATRVHEGTEIIETVSCDQTGRHELPKSFFHFCGKMVGHSHKVGEEARTSFMQSMTQMLRHGTQLSKRVRSL